MSENKPRLTTSGCNNTFKTILRVNAKDNRHIDIKRVDYEMEASHSKKVYKNEKTDIFNDQYKQLKARVLALKEQYINGCIKSSFRNNLTMYPSASSKKQEEKDDRISTIKLQKEIIKQNPEMTDKNLRRQPTYEKFYNEPSKFLKNHDRKRDPINPIRSLSVEEIDDESRAEKLRNRNRSIRFRGYMGSEGLSSVMNYQTESNVAITEKVTKNDYSVLSTYAGIPTCYGNNSKKPIISKIGYQTESRRKSVIF